MISIHKISGLTTIAIGIVLTYAFALSYVVDGYNVIVQAPIVAVAVMASFPLGVYAYSVGQICDDL